MNRYTALGLIILVLTGIAFIGAIPKKTADEEAVLPAALPTPNITAAPAQTQMPAITETPIQPQLDWGLESCGAWVKNNGSQNLSVKIRLGGQKTYEGVLNISEKRSFSYQPFVGMVKTEQLFTIEANGQIIVRKKIEFDCTVSDGGGRGGAPAPAVTTPAITPTETTTPTPTATQTQTPTPTTPVPTTPTPTVTQTSTPTPTPTTEPTTPKPTEPEPTETPEPTVTCGEDKYHNF